MHTKTAKIKGMVDLLLGDRPSTEDEFKNALPAATDKLNVILERYGSSDNKRKKISYFAQLVQEQITIDRCMRQLFSGEKDPLRSGLYRYDTIERSSNINV